MFRLALSIGIWDVDSLAEDMPADLLYEWMAFYQLEPFGDEWLRHAVSACQFYNANRGKSQPAMKPADFMPVEQRPQTIKEIHDTLQRIPRM